MAKQDKSSKPTWPASADPLGEALHFLRMNGLFYTRSEFTAPWGLGLPEMPNCLMFHIVTSGRCWLEDEETGTHLLEPGVFALVPHGQGHKLLGEVGAQAPSIFDLEREEISARYEILRHGGGGPAVNMICGAVKFNHPAAQHLVDLLPRTILVDSWESSEMNWLHSTLRLIGDESTHRQPGGEELITRLADILIIQAIRSWIKSDPKAQTGWLGALQDPQIGQALLLIQREPARAWTVANLADEVAMSRSAFSAKFTALVGETPMKYLTRWRMHMAITWIRDDEMQLGDVAFQLGYQSEAAFNRAFKRVIGTTPGAVRKERVMHH